LHDSDTRDAIIAKPWTKTRNVAEMQKGPGALHASLN
jgi:hypothetical protein